MSFNTYSLSKLGTIARNTVKPVLEFIPRYWIATSKIGALIGFTGSVLGIGYYFYRYGPTIVLRFPLFTGVEIQYDIFTLPFISSLTTACLVPQLLPMTIYISAKYLILKYFKSREVSNIVANNPAINEFTMAVTNMMPSSSTAPITSLQPTTYSLPQSLKIKDSRDVPNINFLEEKPEICPVCCETLDETDSSLSCGHYMHRYCFLKSKKTICPKCRQEVKLSKDEYYLLATNSII